MSRDGRDKNVRRAEGMGTRHGGGVGGVRWFGTHVIEHSKHPSVLWGGGNMAEEVCISNETSPKGSW